MSGSVTVGAVAIALDAPLPTSGTIHALKTNNSDLWWSFTDPTVLIDYSELSPDEDLEFDDFMGKIYFRAASGTQSWTGPDLKNVLLAVKKTIYPGIQEPGKGLQRLKRSPQVV